MTKMKLFADSACDLSREEREKFDIEIVPLTISFDNDSYKDILEIDSMKMIDIVHKTGEMPKTSAPSPFEFENAFAPYVEKGIPIIYIGLSSTLSSTFANAKAAADEFPTGAVHLVDSAAISGVIAALIRTAYKMQSEDMPVLEMVSKLQKMAPRYKLFFTVEKLDFLRKGGRCGNITYLVGSMLGIKPILQVTPAGINLWKSGRGAKRLMELISEEVEKDIGHIKFSEINIASVMKNTLQRESMKKMLSKITGVTKFFDYDIGCTLASHCGESGIGFGYFLD